MQNQKDEKEIEKKDEIENNNNEQDISTFTAIVLVIIGIVIFGFIFKVAISSFTSDNKVKNEKVQEYTLEELNKNLENAKDIKMTSPKIISKNKTAVYINNERVASTIETGALLEPTMNFINNSEEILFKCKQIDEKIQNLYVYEIKDKDEKVVGYLYGSTDEYIFFNKDKKEVAIAKNTNDTLEKNYILDVVDLKGNIIYKFSTNFDDTNGVFTWNIKNLDKEHVLSIYQMLSATMIDRTIKAW